MNDLSLEVDLSAGGPHARQTQAAGSAVRRRMRIPPVVGCICLLPFLTSGDVGCPGFGQYAGRHNVNEETSRSSSTGTRSEGNERDAVVLGAGQQAFIIDGGAGVAIQEQTLSPDEVNRSLEWREGWVVLNGEPLAKVVAEFNRYNVGQLVITDERITELRIEGPFQVRDLKGFLTFLQTQHGITANAIHSDDGGPQFIALAGVRSTREYKKKSS